MILGVMIWLNKKKIYLVDCCRFIFYRVELFVCRKVRINCKGNFFDKVLEGFWVCIKIFCFVSVYFLVINIGERYMCGGEGRGTYYGWINKWVFYMKFTEESNVYFN